MKNNLPNPGSKEAIKQGCICPTLDNYQGKGYMGMEGIFIINGKCPLHGDLIGKLNEK